MLSSDTVYHFDKNVRLEDNGPIQQGMVVFCDSVHLVQQLGTDKFSLLNIWNLQNCANYHTISDRITLYAVIGCLEIMVKPHWTWSDFITQSIELRIQKLTSPSS